jgi:phosphatidylglycerol:prolipoprotein diacylglycerol transferase
VITIGWDPDLVLGSLRISWHSLFAFVAMVIGSIVSIRLSRWLVKDDRVYPFAIAVIVGGLIGARIAHIVDNPATYAGDVGKMVALSGGIGTVGAPLGSSITGYLACRLLRLPRGFMFDITVIGIALGEAIGRIGDVINGEHHGTPCTPPFGICVGYTSPLTLGQPGPVHFIGLYDALLMLVTFVILWTYWHRVRGQVPEGRVWAGYLVLFGFGRFMESFLRQDPVVLWGLQEAHFLGLAYGLVGSAYLVWAARRAKRPAKPA